MQQFQYIVDMRANIKSAIHSVQSLSDVERNFFVFHFFVLVSLVKTSLCSDRKSHSEDGVVMRIVRIRYN